MGKSVLDFEKPLIELQTKIDELRTFTKEKGIDLSDEIATLEKKADNLKAEIYGNLTPWQRVLIARHVNRPTVKDYIDLIFDDFIELRGDRVYRDDPAILGGIAYLNGMPVTVIGHIKGKDTKENLARNFGMAHPEGYRKALRLMKQAEKFNRPVITFIDTPGAYCGIGAEERGQGEAIAKNLMEMIGLKVPLIVSVIGEGGSGGALALGVGDKILMLENSVYSIISPEGFATILWKKASRAQEAAEVMKLTAKDLKELGIIDEIVEESLGGAHHNHEEAAKNLKASFVDSLKALEKYSTDDLLKKRYDKFRAMG